MSAEKKTNIIFMDGKEKLLQKLFAADCFGYLAVGYSGTEDTNGFINIDSENDGEASDRGFIEIVDDTTYARVPLHFESISNRDDDNGKVTGRFTAELDLDNIISNIPINQIAIVDSSERQQDTTFFGASVVDTYTKNEKLSLVFVIEITI